jgi:pimeloyl-ACP methyl ester carboxylesterase
MSTDSSKIYYKSFGDEKSQPAILIHPIGGNMDIWEHEIPFIQKRGFRVIAYELRGHNRSSIGTKKDFTMHDLSVDLQNLVDELGIRRCVLIGHSIGGSIASIYAKHYPDNVDAIIFINSASKRIPDKDLEIHHSSRKIAVTEGMTALAEWEKENNKDAKKTFEDQMTWNYFKKIFTKTSVEGFVAATNALYTMPMGKEDATMALKNSRIRLFGVIAKDDDVFLKLMRDMKEDLPNLEIRVIDGCDHWMIVENPEAVDKALAEFLDIIKNPGQPSKNVL